MTDLTCFKSYDIRGEIGINIDREIAYRIGRAVTQHLVAKSIVIGFDARETSPEFADSVAMGVKDSGANVLDIGLAGTEEMYWAVSEFGADGGIEITASHNPVNFNGMKIVKSESQPLDYERDFLTIKHLAEIQKWPEIKKKGSTLNIKRRARELYIDRILNFVNLKELRTLKIVVNSGNGAAGPTFDAIASRLSKLNCSFDFVRVHHDPDPTFPNGIPNPLIPKNQSYTSEAVKAVGADFGIAFDGDFDRCFFFDENGSYLPSEYIVGLLASIFLEKEFGGCIVHDPRTVWNTQDIVEKLNGIAIESKTGHSYMKQKMRENNAVYGGEMSAHHYFRDFAYCDSGMIPWLLVAELVSKSKRSLGSWVQDRFEYFPSSGELNFRVKDPNIVLENALIAYEDSAISIDKRDGISFSFNSWRFNLRKSNTEPLIRLNVESRGRINDMSTKIDQITKLIGGIRI